MLRNAIYEFIPAEYDGMSFVILKINAASGQPVLYDKKAYIREGSSTTRLEPGSAKEAEFWHRLQQESYELLAAETDVLPATLPQLVS